MSLASCSYQCGWLWDDVTFTVSMLGNKGDLYQRYTGEYLAPASCTPNWDNLSVGSRPILRNVLMESDPTIDQSTLAKAVVDEQTKYYVDGVELEFNSSGISTNAPYAGCFQKLKANSTNADPPVPTRMEAPYGGLEILKNLVTPSGGKTINISVNMGLNADGKAIRKQGSTRIRIIRSNGTANFANIFCSTGSFVLDDNNRSVACEVECFEGDSPVTTFYCKWYLMSGGQWVEKSTANTFTVDCDMVNTFADVKVECYSDSGRTKLIASDVQTINDSSDALILSANPNPADGTFEQNGNIDLTFTPKLTHNDGSTYTDSAWKYTYAVMDSTGGVVQSITTANAIAQGGSFTVPASIANNMGEGPLVNIEAMNA